MIYSIKELPAIHILGRTTERKNPLTLFWTGSGIEFRCKASEVWIEVESSYTQYEPWISIIYNGVPISRLMLPYGRYWICLFRNMNAESVKQVQVLKEVQAMSGDENHYIQIHQMRIEGEFLPLEQPKLNIEFIGDSITSGEGAIGATQEEDWVSMFFSAYQNYAYLTAKELKADVRIISQSGWGVLSSYDNNPGCTLPSIYSKVCGLATGKAMAELGAYENHDFNSWKPDIVVINLGTNDAGAFTMPAWKDKTTGQLFQQRKNEDGSFNVQDLIRFKNACVGFLEMLRDHNGTAYLLWVYGMLGTPLLEAIKQAVEQYRQQSNDTRVEFLQLPEMTQEGIGARYHPGYIAHEIAAGKLTEKVRQVI